MTTRTWWVLIRIQKDGDIRISDTTIQTKEETAYRIRDTLNNLNIHSYVVIPVKEEEI